jgi:hypothetical protein
MEPLGEGDEGPLERTARNDGHGFDPLVRAHATGLGRQLEVAGGGTEDAVGDLEAADAVVALEADVGDAFRQVAVGERDRFRVLVAPARERPAAGRQQRADARMGDAPRPRAVVEDLAAHPGAGIRDGEEALAVALDGETRPAAEVPVGRCEDEPAAILELAETSLAGPRLVEVGDGLSLDGDGRDAQPLGVGLGLGDGGLGGHHGNRNPCPPRHGNAPGPSG